MSPTPTEPFVLQICINCVRPTSIFGTYKSRQRRRSSFRGGGGGGGCERSRYFVQSALLGVFTLSGCSASEHETLQVVKYATAVIQASDVVRTRQTEAYGIVDGDVFGDVAAADGDGGVHVRQSSMQIQRYVAVVQRLLSEAVHVGPRRQPVPL